MLEVSLQEQEEMTDSESFINLTDNQLQDSRITIFGKFVEAQARLVNLLNKSLEENCSISIVWFEVLIRLARSPNHYLAIGELGEQVVLTSGGITRLVDRIEKVGYVTRRPCPQDRRVQYVVITVQGWQKLQEAIPVHLENLQNHLINPLSEEELLNFENSLEKLRHLT